MSDSIFNGCSVSKTVTDGSTNATNVKAKPGKILGVVVNNVNAAVRYLKIYNLAVAPTVGTSVPVMTLAVPAGTVQNFRFGKDGVYMSAGISFAMTTEATDAGTTGVSASEHVVNILYI